MEHSANEEEFRILSGIDFIVPLKQIGVITRSVLEAIQSFYAPRRIIVVAPKNEGLLLNPLVKKWNVKNFSIVPEEEFFIPNFNLSFSDIIEEYDATIEGDKREPGWWIQQLIKLGAATQIQDISPCYIVWDGDLVPTRRWKLCDLDKCGNHRFFIAILQSESRSVFNSSQYADCMVALTGMSPDEPSGGGTFVSHHMAFKTEKVKEMLQLMAKTTGCFNIPWPRLIMSYSRKFFRFSEYKTYATFMQRNYPHDFHYHELSKFGEGGLRFREANSIIDEIMAACPIVNGGIPYDQLKAFVDKRWQTLPGASNTMPSYIQLDHVYGLVGINLNLDEDTPKSPEPTSRPTKLLISSPDSIAYSDSNDNATYQPIVTNKRISANKNSPLRNMFNDPIAVVNEDAKNLPRDDSCIRRVNMRTLSKYEDQFSPDQISTRTMPRRPSNKTYICASRNIFELRGTEPYVESNFQIKTPWLRAL